MIAKVLAWLGSAAFRPSRWLPEHPEIAGEFVRLAVSTAMFQVVSLGVQLLLASVLGPSGYGDLSLLLVAISYLSYLQLGVSNAMNREVPYSSGAGDTARVHRIRSIALGGTIAAAVLGVLGLLLMPRRWLGGQVEFSLMAASGAYLIGYQAYAYVTTYLQSAKLFDTFSRLQVGLAVATIVFTVPGAVVAGVSGAMVGQAAAFGVTAAVAWRLAGITRSAALNFREWLGLVRVGFPIMLVGIGYVFLTTIDRWVVRHYLGSAAVGLYSFQVRLVSVSVMLAGLVANQMYPRMAEAWGRSGNVKQLFPLIRVQVLASLGLSLGAGAAMLLVLPLLVPRLWPDYVPSLRFMPVLLIGMTFLPQCAVFGVVLNVVGRQVPYLLLQVLMIAIGMGLSIMMTSVTRSLLGTATAAAATYGLYLLLLTGMTTVVLRRLRGVRRHDGND